MYFNIELFNALATRAYNKVKTPDYNFSIEDVVSIFRYYFQKYEDVFKETHPNIRLGQIERIIRIMPYIDGDNNSSAGGDIDPDAYETLIDAHFKTQYRNCDYNINHFFSGDIRLLRFYEELY